MTSLLQEIISVYTLLNPSQLTAAASNRVCNALALLQCVASHNETRALFLHGMILCHIHESLINDISPHSALPIPIPEHYLQVETLRISAIDLTRCHWCSSQERFVRCHQLSPDDRDHSPVPPYYGDRL